MRNKCLAYLVVILVVIITTLTEVCGQVCGCTDPQATNYNASATVNDGSCTYASTTISPTSIGESDSIITGTSGMIFWNGGYWTYNDHNNCCLYKLDSTNAAIIESLCINGITNYDTEEISQDSLYLYFGDFGNNAGTRQDLHILRISKASMLDETFAVDTIWFSYEDQTDFTSHPQATDFDCESFVVTPDSIYVFTKQWASEQTSFYSIPKTPGTYVARKCGTYNVGGLVTGATYVFGKQLVALCGYDYNGGSYLSSLHPFIVLLYDFQGDDFFSGNKRRLDFGTLVKDQVEAIATSNALDYYITNEFFTTTHLGITIDRPAKLQKLDLSAYLSDYLTSTTPSDTITPGTDTTENGVGSFIQEQQPTLYPNPVSDCLYIKSAQGFEGRKYVIYDLQGRRLGSGRLKDGKVVLSPYQLKTGTYILLLQGKTKEFSLKFMVESHQ